MTTVKSITIPASSNIDLFEEVGLDEGRYLLLLQNQGTTGSLSLVSDIEATSGFLLREITPSSEPFYAPLVLEVDSTVFIRNTGSSNPVTLGVVATPFSETAGPVSATFNY